MTNPIDRVRALWSTVDDESLSLDQRIANTREMIAIFDALPHVPEAATLVSEYRGRLLPILQYLKERKVRDMEIARAAEELYGAMGAVLEDLKEEGD
jgi:hypothetical protein